MESIAKELEAAAAGLGDDEAALKTYLLAAATAFRTNDWEPANAAWVAMNAQNSKWYVRIAPDEVYYEPCAWKAGFALQLARINPESLEWQKKLDPMKRDMENTLAAMAGKPYRAREVNFKIPDFIDVVLNAGDQRNAHGATIGQSLPNWGAVAEKGGRTVAMTNLYTDADSRTQQAAQMSSLFCKATNAQATTTPRETLDRFAAARGCAQSRAVARIQGQWQGRRRGVRRNAGVDAGGTQSADVLDVSDGLAGGQRRLHARRSAQDSAAQHRLGIRAYLARHVHGRWHAEKLQPACRHAVGCLDEGRRGCLARQ